ncbi:MAG TPA: hypothetical protein VFA59_09615 [Vicinamibacterales bacterium]|nr:hypothetical protein [Vicinamibacterales bacterium]
MKGLRIGTAFLGTLLLTSSLACASPRGRVFVRVGPPAPIVETAVVAPGAGYVWVPGYHTWNGAAYVWVPGRYVMPPRARAVWVPGHWQHERRGWFFVEGHWR